MTTLSSAKLFSMLMDGTADKGNIDIELFLVLHCDITSSDEKVHTRMSSFTVARPQTLTAEGLFESLQSGLRQLGIEAIDIAAEHCKKIVGIRTDVAVANIFFWMSQKASGKGASLGAVDVVLGPQARAGCQGCSQRHCI